MCEQEIEDKLLLGKITVDLGIEFSSISISWRLVFMEIPRQCWS